MIETALILAAGLGTRLAPLSAMRAKAALPVAGEAIIRHQVRWLAEAGVRRVIVNLHHLPATVTAVLGHGDDLGVSVRYSWEARVLGSAGGPRQAFDLVDDERLLVVNGDTITDLDLPALLAAHEDQRPLVTMAAAAARPGYNALLVDSAGAFAGVRPADAPPGPDGAGLEPVHFVGVQIVERRAVAEVPQGAAAETVKSLYPGLRTRQPDAVRVWRSEASFFDVGTPAEYLRTVHAVAARLGRPLDRGDGTHVEGTADVTGTVLWERRACGRWRRRPRLRDRRRRDRAARRPARPRRRRSPRRPRAAGRRHHDRRSGDRALRQRRRVEFRSCADLDPRVADYLAVQGLTPDVQRVVPLTGDASDRRYVRVLLRGQPSVVLSVHAGPIDYATSPFVRVAHLFTLMPLPVPAIVHHDDALGVLGLEDLGDVTLQAHLGGLSATERASRYREAVRLIVRLQQRGAALASPEFPPYGIAFDHEKLTWELEFFVRHFLLAYRGALPPESVREALRTEWDAIVEELASEPRVLCHRDYHSRNLMWHEGALYVIDFQDARMGPDTYDLASLLRDSYVDLPEAAVDDLIADFFALTRGAAGSPAERVEFRRRFDLMALQRNLKALGTFGYQTTTRANPVYMQYVPRTLAYVRRTITRDPRFGRLAELLGGLVDELRYNPAQS